MSAKLMFIEPAGPHRAILTKARGAERTVRGKVRRGSVAKNFSPGANRMVRPVIAGDEQLKLMRRLTGHVSEAHVRVKLGRTHERKGEQMCAAYISQKLLVD